MCVTSREDFPSQALIRLLFSERFFEEFFKNPSRIEAFVRVSFPFWIFFFHFRKVLQKSGSFHSTIGLSFGIPQALDGIGVQTSIFKVAVEPRSSTIRKRSRISPRTCFSSPLILKRCS